VDLQLQIATYQALGVTEDIILNRLSYHAGAEQAETDFATSLCRSHGSYLTEFKNDCETYAVTRQAK
jgi:hypothetical protein